MHKHGSPTWLDVDVRYECARLRISQGAFARRLGVTEQTLYRWLSGTTVPPSPQLVNNAIKYTIMRLEGAAA